MVFRPGDYVIPADLPRRLLCRVTSTETGTTRDGVFQILTLEPVERPWSEWPDAERLVRFADGVRRAPRP